jgi:hypothetical protein
MKDRLLTSLGKDEFFSAKLSMYAGGSILKLNLWRKEEKNEKTRFSSSLDSNRLGAGLGL